MELTKQELKSMSEMIEESVKKECSLYGDDLDIYKKSESYKAKSNLYAKVMSEYYGTDYKINYESIFGLLDLE